MTQANAVHTLNEDDDWFDEDTYDEYRMKWLYAANKPDEFKKYTDAREVGDESQCASLESENRYLPELYDDLGACEYALYQHYESLLVYWFDCFRKNETYAKYCEVRRDERNAEAKGMEATWPMLQQLFSDWGDIHTTKLTPTEWVKENRQLFYSPEFSVVAYGSTAKELKGSLKAELLDDLLKKTLKNAAKSGVKPKYLLTPMPAETWPQLSERISLAWYVHDMMSQDLTRDDEQNDIKIMTSIYFFESDLFRGMGVQQPRHRDGSPMTADEFKNKRSTIEKMLETYQKCIDETINGTFPAKRASHK